MKDPYYWVNRSLNLTEQVNSVVINQEGNMVVVIVKCVGCGAKREINPGQIPKDEVPMCDKCFMPMVPERAKNG